jgi:hypothetical protein
MIKFIIEHVLNKVLFLYKIINNNEHICPKSTSIRSTCNRQSM